MELLGGDMGAVEDARSPALAPKLRERRRVVGKDGVPAPMRRPHVVGEAALRAVARTAERVDAAAERGVGAARADDRFVAHVAPHRPLRREEARRVRRPADVREQQASAQAASGDGTTAAIRPLLHLDVT